MTAQISSYELGPAALAFVCEQLAKGGSLSAALSLSPKGIVWSYLPTDAVRLQNRNNFEQGGIFDSESASEILQKVVAFIKAFLQENPSGVLLSEDRFFRVDDPPNSQDQDIFEWRDTVYHYRTHSFWDAEPRDFEHAITSASDYPLLLILTKASTPELLPKRRGIDDNLASELAKNTAHIIVGAYDEEGYLI